MGTCTGMQEEQPDIGQTTVWSQQTQAANTDQVNHRSNKYECHPLVLLMNTILCPQPHWDFLYSSELLECAQCTVHSVRCVAACSSLHRSELRVML